MTNNNNPFKDYTDHLAETLQEKNTACGDSFTESLADTLLDMAGYSILTLKYLEEHKLNLGGNIMDKVKFLGVGARGKVITFDDTYTEKFLHDHGFKHYDLVSKYTIDRLTTVQTKYGELVVHANDVATYVGDGIWSVSRY